MVCNCSVATDYKYSIAVEESRIINKFNSFTVDAYLVCMAVPLLLTIALYDS